MPIDPDGIDLDWFAVDRDGHIAHFSSAGSRVVPAKVLESEQVLKGLTSFLKELPLAGGVKICAPAAGRIDSWVDMAKRGIFSWDFISEDHNYFEKGHYRLLACPRNPINLSSLDPQAQNALRLFTIPKLCFKTVDRVSKEIIRSIDAEE